MSLEKTYPIRKCIACGEHKTKDNFIMIVRPPKSSNDKNLSIIDGTDKKSGRGYYICKDMKCLKRARKTHRFEKLFVKSSLPPDIYDIIEGRILKND